MVPVIKLPKGVEVFTATPKALEDLWENISCKEILFPDECRLDYMPFVDSMANSLILCYGSGFLRISKVVYGTRCEIHGFVLKDALSRYVGKFRECVWWIFNTQNVKRIECFIPIRAKALKRFLEEIGFMIEGILRDRRKYDGKITDELIMSILYEEAEDERRRDHV